MFNWKIARGCYLPVLNSVVTGQEKEISVLFYVMKTYEIVERMAVK